MVCIAKIKHAPDKKPPAQSFFYYITIFYVFQLFTRDFFYRFSMAASPAFPARNFLQNDFNMAKIKKYRIRTFGFSQNFHRKAAKKD